MKPETITWLGNLRSKAHDPGTIFIAIRTRARRFLIYPEDVLSRTDEQLLQFIRTCLRNAQIVEAEHKRSDTYADSRAIVAR